MKSNRIKKRDVNFYALIHLQSLVDNLMNVKGSSVNKRSRPRREGVMDFVMTTLEPYYFKK